MISSAPSKSRPRRRWLQFSLRTLLAFTLLVSVVCGWFASRLHQARRQSEAVALLSRCGATVKYAHEVADPPYFEDFESEGQFNAEAIPDWQRAILGDEAFKRVVGLGCDPERLTPECAEAIACLRDLEVLCFGGEQRLGAPKFDGAVTDEIVAAIGGLSKLRSFQFEGASRLSDSGLGPLSNLESVETFILGLRPMPPEVFEHVGGMWSLRTFTLSCRGSFDERQFRWLENLVHLERLAIAGSFEGCQSLIPLGKLPKLNELSIYLARNDTAARGLGGDIPPDRLVELGSLRNLQTLEIMQGATDEDVVWLRHLTGMSELSLEFGAGVTDRSVPILTQLKNLRFLNLRQTGITDEGLRPLTKLTKLERLHLDETQVTDHGLACLVDMPMLRFVDLNRANVTLGGIEKLKKSLPHLEIHGKWSR